MKKLMLVIMSFMFLFTVELAAEVDKSELEALVQQSLLKESFDYSLKSFSVFNGYLTSAKNCLDNVCSEADYNEILNNLSDSYDNLVYIGHFNDTYFNSMDLDLDLYTVESVSAYLDFVDYAASIINDIELQSEADQLNSDLIFIINNLQKKLNYDELLLLIQQSQTIDLSMYTLSSVSNFSEVLNFSVELVDNATTQSEIDLMITQLEKAISALVLKEDFQLEYANLMMLINKANNIDLTLYTSTSGNYLLEVLESAISLIDNAQNQDEIELMITKLEKALNSLVINVNYKQLEELVNKVLNIDLNKYVDNGIKTALDEAILVLGKSNSQSEVNNAYSKLLTLYKELKLKNVVDTGIDNSVYYLILILSSLYLLFNKKAKNIN